jgi:hypothetical protein
MPQPVPVWTFSLPATAPSRHLDRVVHGVRRPPGRKHAPGKSSPPADRQPPSQSVPQPAIMSITCRNTQHRPRSIRLPSRPRAGHQVTTVLRLTRTSHGMVALLETGTGPDASLLAASVRRRRRPLDHVPTGAAPRRQAGLGVLRPSHHQNLPARKKAGRQSLLGNPSRPHRISNSRRPAHWSDLRQLACITAVLGRVGSHCW